MAFTASAILRSQYRLAQMYAQPSTTTPETIEPADFTRALITRQRSTVQERLMSNKTTGIRTWYIRPTAKNSADVSAPANCTTPTGDEAGTLSADYDTTVLARTAVQVRDNRSTNEIEFAEELAAQVNHGMAKLRSALNVAVINAAHAAAGANLDDMIRPSWDDASNTPRIVVPETDFSYTSLNEFRIVAKNNNFSDFFFVSGRLFNDDAWMAGLNRLNEGERNAALAWNQRQIYFDERDLDQTLGRKAAFAFDANCYAFWNTYRNTPTPVQLPGADDKWVWVQADPILTWNKNGMQSPIFYEMEMVRTCVGRDAQEFQQTRYDIYMRLLGNFAFCPTGPDGESGVLEFSPE